jgi:NAD-dependent histone deacetylase SIR2
MLYYCMTQNIDDLETKAGVSPQKLIQAHGHSRSAHCIKCKK